MPAPPGTTRKNSDPTRHGKEAQDISAEVERLVRERTQELQAEVDALRRENAQLQHDENVLQENETNYRQLFESMGEGFTIAEMVFDEEGKPVDYVILEINRAYERQSGLSPEQVVGRRVTEFLPTVEPIWFDRFGGVVSTGEPARFEEYNVSLDRWFDLYAFPLHEENRFGVILRDITEGKRVQEMLLESEERLRLAMEAAGMFGWEVDLARQTFTWSENARHVFDFPMPGTLGEAFAMVHPEDLENVNEVFEQAIQNLGEFEIEYRFINRPSDEIIWINSAGVVIADADGVPTRVVGVTQNITERKRAEEAIVEREEQLRNLIENSADGILITDEAGRITTWNRGMEIITGLAARDVLGVPAWELQSRVVNEEWAGPDHRTQYRALWDKLLLDGTYPHLNRLLDVQTRTPEGDVRYLQQNVFTTPTRRGFRVGCIMRDITERKRAEEALRESEARFKTVVETAPSLLIITDKEGNNIYVSPSCEEITGYTREELLEGRAKWGVHPDDTKRVREVQTRAFTNGESGKNFEYKAVKKNGEIWWASQSWEPLRDERGEFQGFVIQTVDITDRKQAEEALREAEKNYRELVRYAPAAIYEMDFRNRRFTSVNDAMCQLLGYSREELLAMDPFDSTDEAGKARFQTRISKWLTGEEPGGNVEYKIRTKDGRIVDVVLNVTFTTDVNGEPLGATVVAHDITERKRAEEALARRTDDLIRLNREVVAARDEANTYLDIMTHDVQNANTVSGMYTDLLVELLAGDQWLYARKLRNSIERSSEILRNVATIRRAHQETGRLVPVNLSAVIREEIRKFPGSSIRYDDLAVEVLADGLLPTVFNNLIGNAVKYGGTDVEIVIRAEERDGEVLVSVEDTGPGVPDEVKEKLFHRFERGTARGSGEGLGLFICRMLVERYGGGGSGSRTECPAIRRKGRRFCSHSGRQITAE